MIPAVDQQHLDLGALERAHGPEAAEAAADHDYAGPFGAGCCAEAGLLIRERFRVRCCGAPASTRSCSVRRSPAADRGSMPRESSPGEGGGGGWGRVIRVGAHGAHLAPRPASSARPPWRQAAIRHRRRDTARAPACVAGSKPDKRVWPARACRRGASLSAITFVAAGAGNGAVRSICGSGPCSSMCTRPRAGAPGRHRRGARRVRAVARARRSTPVRSPPPANGTTSAGSARLPSTIANRR